MKKLIKMLLWLIEKIESKNYWSYVTNLPPELSGRSVEDYIYDGKYGNIYGFLNNLIDTRTYYCPYYFNRYCVKEEGFIDNILKRDICLGCRELSRLKQGRGSR